MNGIWRHRAANAATLADALAARLAGPRADPFASDLVAVPHAGLQRWLTQRLARRLGPPGEGICAGIEFVTVAGLRQRLRRAVTDEPDPWAVGRLSWTLLRVVEANPGEPELARLRAHLAASRERVSVARRLAGLFARYATWRPDLLRGWLAGGDVSDTGEPLGADAWQAVLFRLLVGAVDSDPVTQHDRLVATVAAEPGQLALPGELSIFAPPPLSPGDVALLEALGRHRSVHLWLVGTAAEATPRHPLNQRLGRQAAGTLLPPGTDEWLSPGVAAPASAQESSPGGVPAPGSAEEPPPAPQTVPPAGADSPRVGVAPGAERSGRDAAPDAGAVSPWVGLAPGAERAGRDAAPDTVLGWLQRDLVTDTPPPAGRVASSSDTSVAVHSCHGLDRQVEVLRDAITGLLAADPTLEPRDVVIGCADLAAATPLVTAAFSLPDTLRGRHPACDFRVQVADRTAAQVNPLIGVLRRVLTLSTSRAETADLLDLCAQPSVAQRFGIRADDIERLAELVDRAGIRWGLGLKHRERFGLGRFPHNTWFAGLQRLLLGIAVSEDGLPTVGTTLPVDDVDSSDVVLIGALCELIGRLSRLSAEFDQPATLAGWAERLRRALDLLTLTTGDDAWQRTHAWLGLGALAERGGEGTLLTLAEAERAVLDEFTQTPARPSFGNGSLTVCSLNSLRHVPHRVVCLLGLDDGVFPRRPERDGDDLLLRDPRPGEPDPPGADRQALLDAVLAAQQHLIVTYQGRNAATNEPVHPPAALADFLDALDETARSATGGLLRDQLVTQHKLQPFDPWYFTGVPRSFDELGLRGARALTEPLPGPSASDEIPALPPPAEVTLDELIAFLTHPARYFLRTRTGLWVGERDVARDEIPIELDHLERWQVGARALQLVRAGEPLDRVTRAEWLRGLVPPGQLGTRLVDGISRDVGRIVANLPAQAQEPPRLHDVALDLDGVRITGRLRTHGDLIVTTEFSKVAARHRLALWVRLLVAVLAGLDLRAGVVVGRASRARLGAPQPDEAAAALRVLLTIQAAGLNRVLPLPPRVAEAIAIARAERQDPFDPKVKRLDEPWRMDSDAAWELFFPDLAALLAERHEGWPALDGTGERSLAAVLARAVWDPLLAREEAG